MTIKPSAQTLDDLVRVIEGRPHGRFVLDWRVFKTPNPHVYFLTVDKAACTYVKQTLISDRFGDLKQLDPSHFWTGLNHHGLLHQVAENTLRADGAAVLRDPGSTIVTFCRNPYDRFVSAYLNKILHPHPIEIPYHEHVRREILFHALRSGRYEHNIASFKDGIRPLHFIEFINSRPPVQRDSHWCDQHVMNLYELLPAKELIRFENFQREFLDSWQRHVGREAVIRADFERNASDRRSRYLDEQTAALIYETYRTDFELFGYDKDSWRAF